MEGDIPSRMAFRPTIAEPLKWMDEAIFQPQPMGLREVMLRLALEQRFAFDPKQCLFFANPEGLTVRSARTWQHWTRWLEQHWRCLGRKLPALVDYGNFLVLPDALDAYMDMVRDVASRHYSRVRRYTTGAFLRAKLGEALLLERDAAPHTFESAPDARKYLRILAVACCRREASYWRQGQLPSPVPRLG
jgi:propionate CoA-transferase